MGMLFMIMLVYIISYFFYLVFLILEFMDFVGFENLFLWVFMGYNFFFRFYFINNMVNFIVYGFLILNLNMKLCFCLKVV